MESHAEHRQSKFHLTARQAGEIAPAPNVGAVTPIHFLPRYQEENRVELRAEAEFNNSKNVLNP